MTGKVGRPAIFGEVLYDRFEDGQAVLGGAPFNVAWHLQGFGLRPVFISRVGADAAGQRVLDTMGRWGMDTGGVQQDTGHPTGAVEVRIRDGQPSYDILNDQAYDFIKPQTAAWLAAKPALLYHGSLALRSATSRASLFALAEAGPPAFVDINLRAPWWSAELIEASLKGARYAKLNNEELAEITAADPASVEALGAAGRGLCARYALEILIVTLGADGALMVSVDQRLEAPPVVVDDVVDTVGAGDAFSSVVIAGLLQAWPHQVILQRALHFAAQVCLIRGATTEDRRLYEDILESWQA